jgi:hypothetical protein
MRVNISLWEEYIQAGCIVPFCDICGAPKTTESDATRLLGLFCLLLSS